MYKMLSDMFNVNYCPSWIFIIAFQLKNVKGYPVPTPDFPEEPDRFPQR